MNYPQAIVAAAGILAGTIIMTNMGQTASGPARTRRNFRPPASWRNGAAEFPGTRIYRLDEAKRPDRFGQGAGWLSRRFRAAA